MRWIGNSLIILGIGLILLHFVPNWIIGLQAGNNLQNAQEVTAEEIAINQQTDGEINFEAIDNVGVTSAVASDIVTTEYIVGQLVMPQIEMDLPIYKSLTNDTLMAGAAVMKHHQIMGEGNYALAGHYTHTSPFLFGPLRDAKDGDTIRISDKNKIYEYRIVDIQVVDASAIYMIEDRLAEEHDVPIISLMQCYYENFVDTGLRQFFIGELVDTYEYTAEALYAPVIESEQAA